MDIPVFKRILLKLSGEALLGGQSYGIDTAMAESVAREIKAIAVGAYHGMIMHTGTGEITQAVAALAGIEGRHAAALQEISGLNPLPSAFEEAMRPQVVMTKLSEYGFRGEAIL